MKCMDTRCGSEKKRKVEKRKENKRREERMIKQLMVLGCESKWGWLSSNQSTSLVDT